MSGLQISSQTYLETHNVNSIWVSDPIIGSDVILTPYKLYMKTWPAETYVHTVYRKARPSTQCLLLSV